jgi:hypothetical protein
MTEEAAAAGVPLGTIAIGVGGRGGGRGGSRRVEIREGHEGGERPLV